MSHFAFAQQHEIIFTDFDPDTTLVQGINTFDTIKLDIDYDGIYDIEFYLYVEEHGFEIPFVMPLNGWCISNVEDSIALNVDTLSWRPYIDFGPYTGYFGLKKVVGADCYYGWLYTYDGQTKNARNKKYGTLFIDRMAYCTIPNYPFRAGQTSLTGVEENESTSFATLHPNPTTGLVTITGKDLNQAEVLNMLGQRVAMATGEGERLTVDLNGLPAGVYFVNVTDKEGKKCVRKVVKE